MGYLLSLKKKKRARLFQELYAFNERLLQSLRYEQRPLKEVVAEFELVERIYNGKEELESEDRERVESYINMLGRSDALSQVEFLSAKRDELNALKESAEEDFKRYGSLYIKIFFMVGILVAVLLA